MPFSFLSQKTILVTGGTGSFGNKFVEILLKEAPLKKLVVFSRDELKQSQMQQRLRDERLRYFLGDVRDFSRLQRAFKDVDVVVHAAALKQVPTLEYNPFEAVQTNIIGTQNVVNAAIDNAVEKVLLLSTDKAVNPVNLYGATKLCAEKLVISGNVYVGEGETKLSVSRYGNVVGSRGSLVELLLKQRDLSRVTLTDERMTRFWMTLEQGVHFVLRSLEAMKGGEIFIPKIPSMRVTEVVKALAPNCKVDVIGIRPGEKIHEALMTDSETRRAREFDNYFLIPPEQEFHKNQLYGEGKPVSAGFTYSSDKNNRWLNEEQLFAMIGDQLAIDPVR